MEGRLSTRNVPWILELESNRDLSVNGQMVSSCSVNVVRSSFSTNLLEIRLIGEAESKRHRACEFVISILTSKVGKRITVFCRKIAVREEDFDASEGVGEGFSGRALFEVGGGERERDRDDESEDSLSNLGLICNRVWWNFLHVLQP